MMRGVSVSRAWASTDFDGFKLAPPAMGTGPWGPAISYWLTKQQWTQTALTAVMNEQAEDKALQGFRRTRLRRCFALGRAGSSKRPTASSRKSDLRNRPSGSTSTDCSPGRCTR